MAGPESQEPKEEKKTVTPQSSGHKQSFMEFFQQNYIETIAYLLLFTGLILSIFYEFIGGLLVGLVLGIYFCQEVRDRASAFRGFIDKEGIFRGFIVVAALLSILIMAPGLLIGSIIGAWVRPFLGDAISSPFDKK